MPRKKATKSSRVVASTASAGGVGPAIATNPKHPRRAKVTEQTLSAPPSQRYNLRQRMPEVAAPLPKETVRSTNQKGKAGKKVPSKVVPAKLIPPVTHPEVTDQPVLPDRIQSWAKGVSGDISVEEIPTETSTQQLTIAENSEEIAAYYRSFGYEPPGGTEPSSDEMTSQVTASEQPSEAVSPNKKGRNANPQIRASDKFFAEELMLRNVDVDASVDHEKAAIAKLILTDKSTKPTQKEEEDWKRDFTKCQAEDEAQLQRTIMMELLDRHNLADTLDYVCESTWTSGQIPRKNRGPAMRKITKPRPDLAMAFKTSCLISNLALTELDGLRGHVCPESRRGSSPRRAFHFFAIEVKGMQAEISNSTAHLQNLNTASQALHNMYLIMRKAGDEAIFFREVRFFSAIATTACFEVRVHRAVEDREVGIGLDYPLSFHFEQLHLIEGSYSKAQVSGIVKNILIEYGVKKLLPILKKSLNGVFKKMRTEELQLASQTAGKRPATDPLESFHSQQSFQRQRLNELNVNDAESIPSQAIIAG